MDQNLITPDGLLALRVEILQDLKRLIIQENIESPKRWLRSKEVANMLNISSRTLQNYRLNGHIAYTKFGNSFYYAMEDIRMTLEQNKITKT